MSPQIAKQVIDRLGIDLALEFIDAVCEDFVAEAVASRLAKKSDAPPSDSEVG